ncbi:hypothetical protein CMO91_04175, partial [Candidatus Woesearchaeota archaeon]|nr:hypothetical protein [Candidatus Woesearchaeota archaeon]
MLISSDLVNHFSQDRNLEELFGSLSEKLPVEALLVMHRDLVELLQISSIPDVNWRDLEKAKALFERGKNKKLYQEFLTYLKATPKKKEREGVVVKVSHEEDSQKRSVQDFVHYFNARYKALSSLLLGRPELRSATTVSRILQKRQRETVALIGLVLEKSVTKNGNILLTLEDPTGTLKVLVHKNKPDTFQKARSIVLDEVVGAVGVTGENIMFANSVVWPDTMQKEPKKCPDEVYALFLSDLHVGSNNFLPEAFSKFTTWLQGNAGTDKQRQIATKVKYLFIAGDLVDGVGIYPNQDKELIVQDIYGQYRACAELLAEIPKEITVVVCPGNHDAMRIAEPQPALSKDFARPLYDLPNLLFVSNPGVVTIHRTPEFSGFDVLVYHGHSFDHFIANVDELREQGGYDRADLVMKFLLQRRHLAPTHTSTLYVPTREKDPLVIASVPDFFVTGHIHKSSVSHHKHTTLISGSCWQSKTAFQEKVGHHPEPGRVPCVNLHTREVK